MREVKYLSPTSIQKWCENREEFYRDYLLPLRIDREPQTQPMSIGSSFDAYVKSALFKCIYGPINPKFDFETLFAAQVEPHNRDWALVEGAYVFDEYKRLGAFDDLLVQISHSGAEPKFETDLQGPIGEAVLLGKPDAYYFTPEGHPVIFDWKVNGYCSKSATSPAKGYVRIRGDQKKTSYPGCNPSTYKGTLINQGFLFEAADQKWAAQLSIYAWLCGQVVGKDFVVAIDQIACAPDVLGEKGHGGTPRPKIRVAEHRCLVGAQFQKDLYARVQSIWKQIKSGHIFENLSLEESQQKCLELDNMYLAHMPGYGQAAGGNQRKGRPTF